MISTQFIFYFYYDYYFHVIIFYLFIWRGGGGGFYYSSRKEKTEHMLCAAMQMCLHYNSRIHCYEGQIGLEDTKETSVY